MVARITQDLEAGDQGRESGDRGGEEKHRSNQLAERHFAEDSWQGHKCEPRTTLRIISVGEDGGKNHHAGEHAGQRIAQRRR